MIDVELALCPISPLLIRSGLARKTSTTTTTHEYHQAPQSQEDKTGRLRNLFLDDNVIKSSRNRIEPINRLA